MARWLEKRGHELFSVFDEAPAFKMMKCSGEQLMSSGC